MDKQTVFDLISGLKYGNDKKRCFSALKEYIQGMDPNLDTKFRRRIESALYKVDNAYGETLCLLLKGDGSGEEEGMLKLARESGIPLKEYDEAKIFYEQVSGHFRKRFDEVHDLCSGNGLNGFYWLWKGSAGRVHFYDKKKNSHQEMMGNFFSVYDTHICDILQDGIRMEGDSLAASIHACGNLTDKVIEIAIRYQKPFAVMPCCYEFHDNPYFSPEVMDHFRDKEDVIDAARVMSIQERGYKVSIRNIPKSISDKNRIIIGEPEN